MFLRSPSSRVLLRALAFVAFSGFCTASPAGPVDINTADAATLARELKGIGLKRAQAIVDYRSKNGPFRSPDELALVKGIGPQAIARNRAEIRLEAPRAAARSATAAPAPELPGPVRSSRGRVPGAQPSR